MQGAKGALAGKNNWLNWLNWIDWMKEFAVMPVTKKTISVSRYAVIPMHEFQTGTNEKIIISLLSSMNQSVINSDMSY